MSPESPGKSFYHLVAFGIKGVELCFGCRIPPHMLAGKGNPRLPGRSPHSADVKMLAVFPVRGIAEKCFGKIFAGGCKFLFFV